MHGLPGSFGVMKLVWLQINGCMTCVYFRLGSLVGQGRKPQEAVRAQPLAMHLTSGLAYTLIGLYDGDTAGLACHVISRWDNERHHACCDKCCYLRVLIGDLANHCDYIFSECSDHRERQRVQCTEAHNSD